MKQNNAMTLREIQLAELNILMFFDKVCQDNGFKYFLYYGTLIGAVRHKGFIPWDDDIDVIMPRPDYESFLRYVKNNQSLLQPFELSHYSIDKSYVYPIARFCDTRYAVDYHNVDGFGKGLFIDIYPFDGCGNTKKEANYIMKKSIIESTVVSLAGTPVYTKSAKGLLFNIAKRILFNFAHYVGANRLIIYFDKLTKNKKYVDNKYVACTLWPYYGLKDIALKSELEDAINLEFEGALFPVPKNYDIHLTRIYGDYMTMPSKEEQVGHHYYTAFRK